MRACDFGLSVSSTRVVEQALDGDALALIPIACLLHNSRAACFCACDLARSQTAFGLWCTRACQAACMLDMTRLLCASCAVG